MLYTGFPKGYFEYVCGGGGASKKADREEKGGGGIGREGHAPTFILEELVKGKKRWFALVA